MNEPSSELKRLMQAERAFSAPKPSDRERNRRGLGRQLGLATALGAGAAQGALAAWLTSAASVKFVATVLIVAAGSGGLAYLAAGERVADKQATASFSEPPIAHAQARVVEPSTVVAGAAALTATPELVVAPPLAAAELPKAQLPAVASAESPAEPLASTRAFPAEGTDELLAETRLVGQAHAALRTGRAADALSLLERALQQFPSGALQQETSATRVFALCELGRVNEARAAAALFLRRFPQSLLAGRVRKSCVQ